MPKTQTRKLKKVNRKVFKKDNDENGTDIRALLKKKMENLAKKDFTNGT